MPGSEFIIMADAHEVQTTFIGCFVLVLTIDTLYAQQPDEKKDSSHLYENIEAYSGRK